MTATIPLDSITPSPTNPRKRFDQAKLQELADSIKAKGVLQPILVRPRFDECAQKTAKRAGLQVPTAGYELVAGERRYRAAKLAGLVEIPANVRELTDVEVLECQVIENSQRQDVLPSEEAAGYQALLDANVPVDQVAAKIGKSVSYIRGLLRLNDLEENFLDAVDDGRVPRATAERVARVPGQKARKLVSLCVVQACRYPDGVSGHGRVAPEPLSYRETCHLIEQYFTRELKGCGWDQRDASLVPAAGSCKDCPKRTGNAGEEYKGSRADLCLDTDCFRQKSEAARKRAEQEAKNGGRKVLAGAELKKVFNQHSGRTLAYDSPYLDLDDTCYDAEPAKKYRTLLGKVMDDQVVVAFNADGQRFELLPKEKAYAKLRELKLLRKGNTSSSPDNSQWRAEQARQRKKSEASKAAAYRANALVVEKAEQAFRGWDDLYAGDGALQLLRQLIAGFAQNIWSDAARLVVKRRQLSDKNHSFDKPIRELALNTDSGPELLGLFAELVAARMSQFWASPHSTGQMTPEEKAFWSAFGVDRAKLVKEAEAEKAKPKPAKSKAPPAEPKKTKPESNGAHAEPVDECDESTEAQDHAKKSTGPGPRPEVADWFASAPPPPQPPTNGHANGHHANGTNGTPAEKPYAFEVTVATPVGSERTFDVVAPSDAQARRKAAAKMKPGELVERTKPLTRQQYEAVHGRRTVAGH
jgi:ParB/RepB/Spo0J family partition protein